MLATAGVFGLWFLNVLSRWEGEYVSLLFEINDVPIYAHCFFLNLALVACLLWVATFSTQHC